MAANSKHVSNMYHNTDEFSACFNHISVLWSPKRENWARTSINVQYFMFKAMSENHKNQAGFIVYVILVFTLTLAKCLIHETRCTELVGKNLTGSVNSQHKQLHLLTRTLHPSL